MLPVFTAAEMRALDARAIRELLGISGPRLMDNAGTAAAAFIARWLAPIRGKAVVVVCGKGNNGGDGFVVARRLKARGATVRVFLVGRRADVRGDAAACVGRWRGRVEEIEEPGGLARVRHFTGHNGMVNAISITSDMKYLLAGCEDGTIAVWNLATGKRH